MMEAATNTRPEPSTTGSICSEFLDRPIDVAVVVNKVQYVYKYPISRLFVFPSVNPFLSRLLRLKKDRSINKKSD